MAYHVSNSLTFPGPPDNRAIAAIIAHLARLLTNGLFSFLNDRTTLKTPVLGTECRASTASCVRKIWAEICKFPTEEL